MTRTTAALGLGIAASILLSTVLLHRGSGVLSAAPGDRVRLVVAESLEIGPGATVTTQPVDLAGYWLVTYQITVLSGNTNDLDWQDVYKMRDELDWGHRLTGSVGILLFGSDVLGPIGAVEIRNRGAASATVAVTADLKRRSGGGARIVGNRTVLLPTFTVQPGETGFSEPLHLFEDDRVNYQAVFSTPVPQDRIRLTYERKLFAQQPWIEHGGGLRFEQQNSIGPLDGTWAPFYRYRVSNEGATPVTVRFAAYITEIE